MPRSTGGMAGKTPLIAAARRSTTSARVLLDAGADVDANEEEGRCALYYACYEPHIDGATLLDRGAACRGTWQRPLPPVLSSRFRTKISGKSAGPLATMRARTARLEAENVTWSRLARRKRVATTACRSVSDRPNYQGRT